MLYHYNIIERQGQGALMYTHTHTRTRHLVLAALIITGFKEVAEGLIVDFNQRDLDGVGVDGVGVRQEHCNVTYSIESTSNTLYKDYSTLDYNASVALMA